MTVSAPTLPARSTLPLSVALAGAIGLMIGGGEPNVYLASLALSVLAVGCWLLWRPGESPVFLFVFGYQWLQVSIKVFQANWRGVDVTQLADVGGEIDRAIALSLFGLLALAIGIRLAAGPWTPRVGEVARSIARRYGPLSWFTLFAAAWIVGNVAQSFMWFMPGLTQPLAAVSGVKWASFWMLTYVTFTQPRANRLWWLIAFAVELALSMGGYFSDFKTVFIFVVLAVAAAAQRLSLGRLFGLTCIAAVLLSLGVVWTAVKSEYRQYLSAGERAQVVTVGYNERIAKLATLVESLTSDQLDVAAKDFLARLSYVDYFGLVLQHVPYLMEHEGGALWWDAIRRPFTPRMFFPDKSEINDSDRTALYAGVKVGTADEGVSISIGYMGESYIDFGEWGMMAPLFGLGLFLGGLYRWLTTSPHCRGPLGMGLATVIVFNMAFVESSITKTFGGIILSMLVAWLTVRVVAPKFFPWVLAPANGV